MTATSTFSALLDEELAKTTPPVRPPALDVLAGSLPGLAWHRTVVPSVVPPAPVAVSDPITVRPRPPAAWRPRPRWDGLHVRQALGRLRRLGADLPEDPSPEAVRLAWRDLARALHPDRHGDAPEAHRAFCDLQEAWTLLEPLCAR